MKEALEEFILDGKELVKVLQDKIPIEFLKMQNLKTYNKLLTNLKKFNIFEIEITDLIRLAEIILISSRGENILIGARLYLVSLCCFKHEGEEETLTVYLPSFWLLDIIRKDILSKQRKRYNNLEEAIFNYIKNRNFPIIPEERLKLRIKEFLRRENEKTLFDIEYDKLPYY